jgi:chemotaxis protein CheX
MIATEAPAFVTDPIFLPAILGSMSETFTMTNCQARCVGVSRVPIRDPGTVTGLIGVHGRVSGFVSLNMAEGVARAAVGGLLQDRFDTITGQVIDGVGELTNIVAGGIKRGLRDSQWAFSHMTVPSVIIGQQYQIAYSRGMEFLVVTFEHENEAAVMLEQRLFQVALSLLRL